MQPATAEWVAKAEGDFTTALREYRARKSPNYDAACFHAQQCAEKYLKALLQERGIEFDKTHDLIRLANLMKQPIGLAGLRQKLAMLSAAAVEFRYPGEMATREIAMEAIRTCKAVRTEARNQLSLKDF
jgi:HEPN domain-containing protein